MKLVLLILGNHAHDDGTHIWPGIDLIAERACLDQRNVRRILDALCRDGVLVKVRTGGGRTRASEYAIRVDKIADAPFGMVHGKRSKTMAAAPSFSEENPGAGAIENPGAGATESPETRALAPKNPGAGAPPTVNKPSLKPKATVRKEEPSRRARPSGKTKRVSMDEPSIEHLQLANLWQLDIDHEFEKCVGWFAKNNGGKPNSTHFTDWLIRAGEMKRDRHKDQMTQRPGENFEQWKERTGAI